MRVAFLGPPGAGKGTQASELAREWSVPHIATGDMLRAAVAAGTPLAGEARAYMDRGELVPDSVIVAMVGERLAQADAARGYILDGVPRTVPQAEALDQLLKDRRQALDRVVYFDVSEAEILRRMTGRRVCRRCGETFHVISAPPKREAVCDRCDGELYHRDDDSEATVRRRLEVYAQQTAPLLAYYRDRGMLATVPGQGAIDDIRAALRRIVDGVPR
ncbi:MAG: adenylate kinase [Candidatus Rokubacteria bacterium]|nr:adenylate kinase [Candidatus Rokubacteria bacterium]